MQSIINLLNNQAKLWGFPTRQVLLTCKSQRVSIDHLQKTPQKNMQTLNCYNFYISQFQFNFPFPHILYATVTILVYQLPNTNMHITASISPQVHINIKNSSVFPFSQRSTFSSSSLGPDSYLTSLCMPSIHTLLYYAVC